LGRSARHPDCAVAGMPHSSDGIRIVNVMLDEVSLQGEISTRAVGRPSLLKFCDGIEDGISQHFARMNSVLKLLLEGGNLNSSQMSQILKLSEADVTRQLDELKQQRVLLGWRPVLNLSQEDAAAVRAVIEVRITPERGGGFNRMAERISRFDEVESCHLMSGGYDLLVFVNGKSLQKVAAFVSEKLSSLEGVLSTSTHFLLRTYKESGFLLDGKVEETERLKVAP
jgi:DNA-binding Lrp family transcriptional regulator